MLCLEEILCFQFQNRRRRIDMIRTTKTGIKLSGFYRGIVLAHVDAGKCKIFWPGVISEEYRSTPEKLPDAEQASPIFMSSGSADNGVFFYPAIGTVVWGFFANEDINYPVYFASSLGFDGNKSIYGDGLKKDQESSSKNVKIIKNGNLKITFGTNESDIEVNNGKASINLKNDGTIEIKTDGELDLIANTIKLRSSGNTEFYTRNLKFNAAENITSFSKRNQIRTHGGGTSIKGDLPKYGIQIW